MTRRRRRPAPRAVVGVFVCAALASCSAPPSTPAVSTELPAGVSVEVVQLRGDRAADRVQLRVTNDGDRELEITSASLAASLFPAGIDWTRAPATVRAGGAVDLPLVIADLACPDTEVETTATLTVVEDGTTTTARVAPADSLGALERLESSACAEDEAARTVSALATGLRVDGSGVESVAHLAVRLTPAVSASGRVEVSTVRSTVLLTPLSGQEWPVNLSFDSTSVDPVEIELAIVPRRCDAHALAEDKVGTLFPVLVSIDGEEAEFTLPLAEGVKNELLNFVSQHCGLGAP